MNLQTVIGWRTPNGWRPTALFLATWRARPGLQPQAIFADLLGRPTPSFAAIWRAARGTGLTIHGPIVTETGSPTPDFLRAMTS